MENAKIMIVDDEETLAMFLQKVLQEENPDFEIEVKKSGEEALEALADFMPDLVLLDIKLPEKDGTEVLKEIKEYDMNIQVVMMTGYASLDSAVASLREGAYDYLNKPFESSQVKTIVKNAIERRMLLREREILISDLSEANEKLSDANVLLKEKKTLVDKELQDKIEQLSKLNKISNRINAEVNVDKFIKQIPGATVNLFESEGSMVLFLDDNKKNLIVKSSVGDNMLSPGTPVDAGTSPFDVSSTKKSVSQEKKVKIDKKEIGPIVCSSLSSGGQNIGALCVVGQKKMDKETMQLLNTFSSTVSIALKNSSLIEDLKRSSLEVILSLLLIEGFKNPTIKEHSENVSELSESLAIEMGVDKEDIRNVKYAALIHDLGEVVLEEDTPDYKQVLDKTVSIVGHVKFLKKSIDILKNSIEQFSKKGDKVPLISRIFAVVNSFDKYARKEKDISAAMEYLEKEKGKQFDPEVVDSFKKILGSKTE
jgi:response regulator RpfG family c-di-GMP phosphodiesterase